MLVRLLQLTKRPTAPAGTAELRNVTVSSGSELTQRCLVLLLLLLRWWGGGGGGGEGELMRLGGVVCGVGLGCLCWVFVGGGGGGGGGGVES